MDHTVVVMVTRASRGRRRSAKRLLDRDQDRPEREDVEEGDEIDAEDRDVAPWQRERLGSPPAQIEQISADAPEQESEQSGPVPSLSKPVFLGPELAIHRHQRFVRDGAGL
jgi:hypothetical protein